MTKLILLSGMTESGKSSAGQYFGGKPDAKRVKFVQVVMYPELQANPDMNPYEAIDGIINIGERFCDHFHRFEEPDKKLYVIESVFDPKPVSYIKERFDTTIVFIDAPLEKRIEHCAENNDISLEEASRYVQGKDQKKIGLGAYAIKDMAQITIVNNGTLFAYGRTLSRVYKEAIQ